MQSDGVQAIRELEAPETSQKTEGTEVSFSLHICECFSQNLVMCTPENMAVLFTENTQSLSTTQLETETFYLPKTTEEKLGGTINFIQQNNFHKLPENLVCAIKTTA